LGVRASHIFQSPDKRNIMKSIITKKKKKKSLPKTVHLIAYIATAMSHYLSKIIPLKAWILLGRSFGSLLYMISWNHTKIALTNLRFALGEEKDKKEYRRIARETFQQFGMSGFEWIRIWGINKDKMHEIFDLISFEGKEHLDNARRKSKFNSVILLSSHSGNWEYAHIKYASTINPLTFIVRKIDNPFLEKKRLQTNSEAGVKILYKENGLRYAIKNLKNSEDMVIFADRKARKKEGIPSQFFGHKTSTLSIVPALAMKYKVPVVPMCIFREPDLIHHKIKFFPALDIDGLDIPEATLVQNRALERIIRDHPNHWLWFHRKWKCYHSDIYK